MFLNIIRQQLYTYTLFFIESKILFFIPLQCTVSPQILNTRKYVGTYKYNIIIIGIMLFLFILTIMQSIVSAPSNLGFFLVHMIFSSYISTHYPLCSCITTCTTCFKMEPFRFAVSGSNYYYMSISLVLYIYTYVCLQLMHQVGKPIGIRYPPK